MNLKNRTVIITGSSSGIGQAAAIRFAKEGARVVVNYRVNKKGALETQAHIRKLKRESLIVQADVSTSAGVTRLFRDSIKKFKKVDILINNGAIGTDVTPFMDATAEDMIVMLRADLLSVMLCSQQAIKLMQQQGHGKIINTSSIRGWEHGGRAPVYAAAKAGVNSLTRTLAKEVAPAIQVNAVAPGFVKTRSYDGMTQEKIDSFLKQTYLKRWVTPEEIADTFVFLAKNDAITGQVLYVDAGFTLK